MEVCKNIYTYKFNSNGTKNVSMRIENQKEVPNSAFYNCTKLTSVKIPDSVTSIEDYAFSSCSGLTSVTVGNLVTSISSNAFQNCSGLKSVIWNATNYPDFSSYSSNPFYNFLTQLTTFEFGDNVKHIPSYMCYTMYQINSITIPDSVTSIGNNAFDKCGLTSIEIPSQVINIGNQVFRGCLNLTSISVDDNNVKYDSRDNCNAIIETKTNSLIQGCKNTIIPNSVTSINNNAFQNCGLTSITIPDTVTSIGNSAFDSCLELTSITIPHSVTSIGNSTFYGCTGLASIVVDENNLIYDSRDNCNAIIETKTNKLIYGCNNTIIPNSVTSISNNAFWGCSGLASVTIPNSVSSIGKQAFSYCSGLTSIEIPSQVTIIDDSVFSGCSGLTSITISNSVRTIGVSAFQNCSSLTSITFPNSVRSFGNFAFSGCSSLTSVEMGNNVIGFGQMVFVNCSSPLTITIKTSNPPSLWNTSFGGASISSIYVPDSSVDRYKTAPNWSSYASKIKPISQKPA